MPQTVETCRLHGLRARLYGLPSRSPTKAPLNQRSRASTARFHNKDAIIRLVGAVLLEQNDERAAKPARYMVLETVAPLSDNSIVSLPAVAD
jgi:hypothetical protein